jgi:hypothetical protein
MQSWSNLGGKKIHNNPAEAGSCSIWPLSCSKEVFLLWRDPTGRWLLVTNSLIRPECVLTARLSCTTSSCHSLTWLSLKLFKSMQYIRWNWNLFVIVTMILYWRVGSRLCTPHFDFWVHFETNARRKHSIGNAFSYNKSQQDALFLKLILAKNSTCFGQI